MPIRVTDSNGIKQVVLKEEETKLLSQLMTELKFNNVDFMITKMVIYDWPQADVLSDDNNDNNNNAVPDEKDDNKESLEELENNRYLNRLSKWRHLIKTDNFCYRHAVGTCYQQNAKKGCKSLINVFRKHGKSFNINQLYKNGNTTIKNKRRAFYLSHYLKDHCGMENSYVINNFNKQIINDKDYDLLKINYKNTLLGKKEKRMRRKKNGKKNVQMVGSNSNGYRNKSNKTTLGNNGIQSSLMKVQNTPSLNEISEDNKLSDVLSTESTGQDDVVSVITVSDNSVTNTFTNTDDMTSNGDGIY